MIYSKVPAEITLPEAPSDARAVGQTLRRLTAAPTSLPTRWLASSVLMARVLLRNQSFAERFRKRVANPEWHGPVAHGDLSADSFVEISSLEGPDLARAELEQALAAGVPTVLRGYARGSKAVRSWCLDFFEETCGDRLVPMFTAHEPAGRMLLRDVLTSVRNGAQQKVQVNNACDVLQGDLDLVSDLPVRGLSRTLQSVRYHGANLFISGEGDGSGYHCANEVNFFFQVYGEKEWFFVHPRYTTQMDPRFTTPRCNYFGSGLKWGEHPRHVPIGRVLLQPGDVLINPPWWWHWVRNRSTSIGVATRWRSWRHRIASPGSLLTGLQWLFPYQWKIIWTDYVRGEVLNDRKWVHEEVPRLPGGAAPEVSRSREFSRRRG